MSILSKLLEKDEDAQKRKETALTEGLRWIFESCLGKKRADVSLAAFLEDDRSTLAQIASERNLAMQARGTSADALRIAEEKLSKAQALKEELEGNASIELAYTDVNAWLAGDERYENFCREREISKSRIRDASRAIRLLEGTVTARKQSLREAGLKL